jgi:hypothetical protein
MNKTTVKRNSSQNEGLSPSCIALSFDGFGSISWHSICFFSAFVQFSQFFSSDFQLFRPEYHWGDLSNRNAHLVHQTWYRIIREGQCSWVIKFFLVCGDVISWVTIEECYWDYIYKDYREVEACSWGCKFLGKGDPMSLSTSLGCLFLHTYFIGFHIFQVRGHLFTLYVILAFPKIPKGRGRGSRPLLVIVLYWLFVCLFWVAWAIFQLSGDYHH